MTKARASAPPQNNGWLTLDDAANHVRLSRRTLERAVANGTIPYARDPLTGRVRFHRDELDAWMTNGRRRR